MTVYKTRPGVVLAEIAGEYVLVSAKALFEQCPYVTQINETSAFLWERLEGGATLETLLSAVAEEFELDDPEAARASILDFIHQMSELNFLISEELSS